MNKQSYRQIGSLLLICLMSSAIGLFAGCKKKVEQAAPQPAQSDPQPAAAAPAVVTAPTAQATANADTRINEAKTAVQSRDYEKAVETLLSLQGMPLSEQQAAIVAGQMEQFQGNLARAIASGDPKAKAAADKLRARASGAR